MIDTVSFRQPFTTTVKLREPMPDGWTRESNRRGKDIVDEYIENDQWERYFTYKHEESGVWVLARDRQVVKITASLPRVYYGSNALLLATQQQIDAALLAVRKRVEEIATCDGPIKAFSRVDLVWHFLNCQHMLRAHYFVKHPLIRKPHQTYDGSLVWGGGKSENRCTMYDKSLKLNKIPGDIVRIEWQLKRRKLCELFDADYDLDLPVDQLVLEDCYRVYRDLMLGFDPAPVTEVTPESRRIVELLALAQKYDHRVEGVPYVDVYTRGMSTKNVARIRKTLASVRVDVHQIKWADLLPPNTLPPVYTIATKEVE